MARTLAQIETSITNKESIKILEYLKDYFVKINNLNTDKLNTLLQDIYNHVNGLDVIKGQLIKPLPPEANDPDNPTDGSFYFNTASKEFKMYHNNTWTVIAALGALIDAYTKAEADAKYETKLADKEDVAIGSEIRLYTQTPGFSMLQLGKSAGQPSMQIGTNNHDPHIEYRSNTETTYNVLYFKDIATKDLANVSADVLFSKLTDQQKLGVAKLFFTEAVKQTYDGYGPLIKTNETNISLNKAKIDSLSGGVKVYHYADKTTADTAKSTITFNEGDIAWIGSTGDWIGYHFIGGNWVLNGTVSDHQATIDAYTKVESDSRFVHKTLKFKPHATSQPGFIVLNDTGISGLTDGTQITLDLIFIQELLSTPSSIPADTAQLFIGSEAVRIPNSVGSAALKWKTKTNATDINVFDNYLLKDFVFEKATVNGTVQWNFIELVEKTASYALTDLSNIDIITWLEKQQETHSITELINDKILRIPAYTFEHSTTLIKVALSQAKIIGESSFNAAPITSLSLPKVTSIGDYAFNNFAGTDINLPEVTDIGGRAFYRAMNITSLDLPKVVTIGDYAFYNYKPTNADINLPEATDIGERAFYNAINIGSINAPKLVTIGDYAFSHVGNITELNFPKVTSIGKNVFHIAKNITSINLPEVTSIGNLAISYYAGTALSLPKVTSIGTVSFDHASNLNSLSIPEATDIGERSFMNSPITSLNAPKLVTIGDRAFIKIINVSTTTVTLPTQFNTDVEKNRIFGAGHWDQITFTWTQATNGGVA